MKREKPQFISASNRNMAVNLLIIGAKVEN